MAPHLDLLLLPPAALAIAATGRRRVTAESAGPQAPHGHLAASCSFAVSFPAGGSGGGGGSAPPRRQWRRMERSRAQAGPRGRCGSTSTWSPSIGLWASDSRSASTAASSSTPHSVNHAPSHPPALAMAEPLQAAAVGGGVEATERGAHVEPLPRRSFFDSLSLQGGSRRGRHGAQRSCSMDRPPHRLTANPRRLP
ncbi:unnamed protein product [Urochloa humidicola]